MEEVNVEELQTKLQERETAFQKAQEELSKLKDKDLNMSEMRRKMEEVQGNVEKQKKEIEEEKKKIETQRVGLQIEKVADKYAKGDEVVKKKMLEEFKLFEDKVKTEPDFDFYMKKAYLLANEVGTNQGVNPLNAPSLMGSAPDTQRREPTGFAELNENQKSLAKKFGISPDIYEKVQAFKQKMYK